MPKKKKLIKKFSRSTLPLTKTNPAYISSLSDKDIESAVSSDPDAAPILDKTWFKKAKPLLSKEVKSVVSIRLNQETIDWYKQFGKGHSGFMARILEYYAATHKNDSNI